MRKFHPNQSFALLGVKRKFEQVIRLWARTLFSFWFIYILGNVYTTFLNLENFKL